jgi:vitamin B12 transporter
MQTQSLFLYSLLLSAGAVWAADGVVVDPSGRPVQNASVECAGATATTGEDGRFSFPQITRCRAAASAPGFETARLEVVSGQTARIELAIAGLHELLVVTATRRETAPERAGVAATVLSGEELARRQSPGLSDALREIPGIEIVRYGRTGSLTQVFTRGGQRTGALVMVDGIPMNDPGGELNLSGFTAGALDRIEVVRGPESALFGTEAASGVIQLFTRRGDPENTRPHGSLSYERGSFQTDRWAASLAGGSGERLDYSLAAEQFHTVGEYVNDYFRNTTGTANAGYRLAPSTQIRGVFRSFDSMIGTPDRVGYGLFDLDANEATRDTAAGLRLEDVRGPSYSQRISVSYHRSHDLFINDQMDGPYDVAALVRDVTSPVPRTYFEGLTRPDAVAPPGLRVATPAYGPVLLYSSDPYLSLSSRTGAEYQGVWTHKGGSAVFGYAYERQAANLTGDWADRNNHGFFVHEQATIGQRLSLAGGLRVEHNSAFGWQATPRAAASYRIEQNTTIRASVGLGFTAPSLLQNFARDPWFVGNAALKPEKTTSFEAGVMREWFGRRLRTDVSAFSNSYRDLIAFVYSVTPSTWQNVEASRARGLEFSAQARANSYLSFRGGHTRMWTRITKSNSPDSRVTGVGQELAHRPGNSGSISASLAPRRWSLQAGATFAGESQDQDLFGVTRVGGHQTVYVAGELRVHRNVIPYVRVENLTNQRYQEILGYPAASRGVNGGLRFEW